MVHKLELEYQHFDSLTDLSTSDIALIAAAREAAGRASAQYSNFAVGAAARLDSGRVVSAANVESEVYPAGICAERNLLFGAVSSYPTDPIVALAIVSPSTDSECYPCGLCRQTLLDVERRQQRVIRVIMAGESSATVVESAKVLMPFAFSL